jgi:hypothetical protein
MWSGISPNAVYNFSCIKFYTMHGDGPLLQPKDVAVNKIDKMWCWVVIVLIYTCDLLTAMGVSRLKKMNNIWITDACKFRIKAHYVTQHALQQ